MSLWISDVMNVVSGSVMYYVIVLCVYSYVIVSIVFIDMVIMVVLMRFWLLSSGKCVWIVLFVVFILWWMYVILLVLW